MVRQRVRMRFSKEAEVRLIGHRDLVRCLERAFRRAGLPLAMSQGFHPKPRMSFPSALAVGIEAVDEVAEFELSESLTAEQLCRRIEPELPAGLRLRSIEVLPEGAKKCRAVSFSYQVPIPADRRAGVAERIERLLARPSWQVERPDGRAAVDLRETLEELSLEEGVLRMRLGSGPGASAGPRDVLAALGQSDLEAEGVHLTRTAVEIE